MRVTLLLTKSHPYRCERNICLEDVVQIEHSFSAVSFIEGVTKDFAFHTFALCYVERISITDKQELQSQLENKHKIKPATP